MKLSELTEAFNRHEFTNIDKLPGVKKKHTEQDIADIIAANCSTMVAAIKGARTPLLRGTDTYRDVDVKATMTAIRKNRRSVQMPESYHEALKEIFTKCGLVANRTNSIFCTTNPQTASAWGDPSIIFVKDGWTGTVFDKITDDYLYHSVADIAGDYLTGEPKEQDKAIADFKRLKPRSFSTAAELQQILKREYYDILITGDSYIALTLYEPNGMLNRTTLEILKLLGIKL